jgi:hypothetical protein
LYFSQSPTQTDEQMQLRLLLHVPEASPAPEATPAQPGGIEAGEAGLASEDLRDAGSSPWWDRRRKQ